MRLNFLSVFVGVMSDVSTQKAAQAQLQLAASVFSHAREGILITNAAGDIVQVNEAFCRITGYTAAEVVGRNPRILSSGIQDQSFYQSLWHDLQHQGYWYGEVWNRRKGGEVYAEMLTISAVKDPEGRVSHYVALFSDITTLKEKQSQLEHVAHYDALTQLPNRVLLADRLRQGMHQAQRRQQALAVAFLDLDGFKAVNDTHGHDAGDHLLVTVAQRMREVLRDGDTLARMGGDEFVVVLADTPHASACVPLLTRLLAAASTPVAHGSHTLQVSASLGITFYPQAEEVDAEQLMRQADQAMYQAKVAGKNRYQFFDPEADRSARVQHESLDRLRLALNQGEMVLYYQPKVNLRTGQLRGVEALIRWQHPERGLLLPADFLPALAGHPLAQELGEWVIRTALAQISQWQAEGLDLAVSVNVDADQVQHADFVAKLRDMLAVHPGLAPDALELEVVESQALDDLDAATQAMAGCQAIGVSFALDDFGTGYSSLAYLKRLPVKLLKIDQSFVRDMLDDPEDLTILDGVISLAGAFRREVLAEGLETEAHGALLLRLGCELAQGYGIARPMPAHQVQAWARSWRPPTAWAQVKPVRRDQLPLLFASIETRAWFNGLVEHLTRPTTCPPPDWQHLQAHLHPLRAASDTLAPQTLTEALDTTLQALERLTRQPGQTQPPGAELWQALALRDRLLQLLEQALTPPAP